MDDSTGSAPVAAVEGGQGTLVADLQRQKELLELDKTFLQRELEGTRAKAAAAQQGQERAKEEIQELKRRNEELAQQLLGTQAASDRRLEAALKQQRQRRREGEEKTAAAAAAAAAERRMGLQEAAASLMASKEYRLLFESRQEAASKAEGFRLELQELQRVHQDLVLRHAKAGATHRATVAGMTSEARARAFELSRARMLLDEKAAALDKAERTIALLRAQLDARQHEHSQLEQKAARQECELSLALQQARDRLRAHELLERQLDAMARTAPSSSGPAAAVPQQLQALNSHVAAHPCRMHWALQLAARLHDRDQQLARLQRERSKAADKAAHLQQRVGELTRLLEDAAQPGAYVVGLVREKDRAVDALRAELAEATRRMEAWRAEAQAAVAGRSKEEEKWGQGGVIGVYPTEREGQQQSLLQLGKQHAAAPAPPKWHVRKR